MSNKKSDSYIISDKDSDEKYKICKLCNIKKTLNNFHKDSNIKDGHKNECIECRSTKRKKQYKAEKEKKKPNEIQLIKKELTDKILDKLKKEEDLSKLMPELEEIFNNCKTKMNEYEEKKMEGFIVNNKDIIPERFIKYVKDYIDENIYGKYEIEYKRTETGSRVIVKCSDKQKLYKPSKEEQNKIIKDYITRSDKQIRENSIKIEDTKYEKEKHNNGDFDKIVREYTIKTRGKRLKIMRQKINGERNLYMLDLTKIVKISKEEINEMIELYEKEQEKKEREWKEKQIKLENKMRIVNRSDSESE